MLKMTMKPGMDQGTTGAALIALGAISCQMWFYEEEFLNPQS